MRCPHGHCLCNTLQKQSSRIWNNLQDAYSLGVRYHEDTITQSLILDVKRSHPADIKVHVFSRARESRNGSDFICILLDSKRNRMIYAAVQAKRLYSRGEYQAFEEDQVDKIINFCSRLKNKQKPKPTPIFLFYNCSPILRHVSKNDYLKCICLPWCPCACTDWPRDLGMTYVHASSLPVEGGSLDLSKLPHKSLWPVFCTCRASVYYAALLKALDKQAAGWADRESSHGWTTVPGWMKDPISDDKVKDKAFFEELGIFESEEAAEREETVGRKGTEAFNPSCAIVAKIDVPDTPID